MRRNERLTLADWHEEYLLGKAEFDLDILADKTICNVFEDDEENQK